jgi:putative peptide zinc metalloprotease protein
MTGLARRTAFLILLVLACALLPGSAPAADIRHKDNVATAITEQDDSRVFDFAWHISKQRGGVVDHLNSAYARATCTRCGATAIAFQIVIASGAPSTTAPRNLAEAYNVECTECVVAAHARQFVRVVESPVKITGAGRAELASVRRALRALEGQDLSFAQVYEAVEAQEARVRSVLGNELVLKSDPDTEAEVLERQLFEAADIG